MSKNRMEALSDGVIAIIITIMVLDMKSRTGRPSTPCSHSCRSSSATC